jgi:hypothetical protein
MKQRNLGTTPAPKLEPTAASIPRDTQISVADVRLSKNKIEWRLHRGFPSREIKY